MNNLSMNRSRGVTRQGLRIWGLLFIVLGTAGQCILQNAMLGVNSASPEELLVLMENPDNMAKATVAIVLQFVLACAIPIFSFLLVEGVQHTSSMKNYFLRVAGVALLSEIPFNLAMSGKWLDLDSRNPVFGMVLALVMLYIYRHYAGVSVKNVLIKILVLVVAIFWVEMLRIHEGAAVAVMVAVLWSLRNKRAWQVLAGCAAMFVCTVFSLFYLVAPLMFMMVHFYNGEPGECNKLVNYLAYPVLLLVIGLVGMYGF